MTLVKDTLLLRYRGFLTQSHRRGSYDETINWKSSYRDVISIHIHHDDWQMNPIFRSVPAGMNARICSGWNFYLADFERIKRHICLLIGNGLDRGEHCPNRFQRAIQRWGYAILRVLKKSGLGLEVLSFLHLTSSHSSAGSERCRY